MELGFHFNEQTFVRNLTRGFLLLIGFELLLSTVYFLNEASPQPVELIHSLIKLDGEGSITSWFSATQLFVIALVFLSLSFRSRSEFQPSPWFLRLGSLAFFFLSFDEGAGFHEKLTFFLIAQSWAPKIQDGRGTWIVTYVILAVLILAVSARELIRLVKFSRRGVFWMGLGLAVFIIGAGGLESVAYAIWQLESEALAYQVEVVFEETMEMIGASMILYGLLLVGHRISARHKAPAGREEPGAYPVELFETRTTSKKAG